MPVAERNNHWTVRLKILRESDDNISFDATYFPGTYFGIYVREVGKTSGNPHYHLAMSFDKPKTNKQVTAMILKKFPHLAGSKNHQKSQWYTGHDLTKDEFIQYMWKENTPSKWGHRDDWLGDEHFEEQCITKFREIMANKSRAEKGKKQGKLPDAVEYCLSHPNIKGRTAAEPVLLLREVLDVYESYHHVNRRRIKSMHHVQVDIENIMFHSGNKLNRQNWKRSIIDRITRQYENIHTY